MKIIIFKFLVPEIILTELYNNYILIKKENGDWT